MKVNSDEVEYWDRVAKKATEKGAVANYYKIGEIVRRLLRYSFWGTRVLEIGAGQCLVAMNLKNLAHFEYIGTEISQVYCRHVNERMGLGIMQADITDLPVENGTVDFLLALDVLEHVRPDIRYEGYQEIGDKMRPGGLMFINNPVLGTVSYPKREFEFPFNIYHLDGLIEDAGLELLFFERYGIDVVMDIGTDHREYEWMVLRKK